MCDPNYKSMEMESEIEQDLMHTQATDEELMALFNVT